MNDVIKYVEPPASYQCDSCWRRYPKTMFDTRLWKYKRICDHCLGFILDSEAEIDYNEIRKGDM